MVFHCYSAIARCEGNVGLMSKSFTFKSAPPHIRAAIREQAHRWETTDGVPLIDLLPSDDDETEEAE